MDFSVSQVLTQMNVIRVVQECMLPVDPHRVVTRAGVESTAAPLRTKIMIVLRVPLVHMDLLPICLHQCITRLRIAKFAKAGNMQRM